MTDLGEGIPAKRPLDNGAFVWAVAKPAADRVAIFRNEKDGRLFVSETSRADARALRDSLSDALDDFDRAADMAGDEALGLKI